MGANDKLAATYFGLRCSGECCRGNPFGVCAHSRACQFHLREEAARIKAEVESSARIDGFKPWR